MENTSRTAPSAELGNEARKHEGDVIRLLIEAELNEVAGSGSKPGGVGEGVSGWVTHQS